MKRGVLLLVLFWISFSTMATTESTTWEDYEKKVLTHKKQIKKRQPINIQNFEKHYAGLLTSSSRHKGQLDPLNILPAKVRQQMEAQYPSMHSNLDLSYPLNPQNATTEDKAWAQNLRQHAKDRQSMLQRKGHRRTNRRT